MLSSDSTFTYGPTTHELARHYSLQVAPVSFYLPQSLLEIIRPKSQISPRGSVYVQDHISEEHLLDIASSDTEETGEAQHGQFGHTY